MNFNFTKIKLPFFSDLIPLELLKRLEHRQNTFVNSQFLLLQKLPNLDLPQLRTLDEIIETIENDRFNNIQLLEWLYCISYKSKWDALHPNRSLLTSLKIWVIAKEAKPLKQFLFWKLSLKYGDRNNKLADSLVDGFKSFIPESIEDKEIVNIIKILAGASADEGIAEICKQDLLTPHSLFNSYKLPAHRIEPVASAYDRIADLFISINKPNDKQVKWLLDCLEQMTLEQEIKAVDRLLTKIGAEIGIDRPDLVNWISARYSVGGDKSPWYRLSKESKEALRKWQGAVNYGDFQKLVYILLNSNIILLETDSNRLKARKTFWSHYTDRFERIRILVPESSLERVKNSFDRQDISVLKNDGEETEICIFDFKDWLVVEFFRGNNSEIRIFPSDLENKLFHESNLSVSSLRALGGDIHDHVFCWQNSCVKWLMDKRIYPNEGTKYFSGVPQKASLYDPIIGLPPLPLVDRLERERKLNKWQQHWNRIQKPPTIAFPSVIEEPDDLIPDTLSIDNYALNYELDDEISDLFLLDDDYEQEMEWMEDHKRNMELDRLIADYEQEMEWMEDHKRNMELDRFMADYQPDDD
jgi:hypothetical protein